MSFLARGHGHLRNLALSLHRFHGATNIAAACRRISRYPDRILRS